MIVYQLRCSKSHEFEAWFRDSKTYDKQCAANDIDCPFCGDQQVSKAIMAPRLSTGETRVDEGSGESEVRAQEVAEQILDAVDKLRRHVEKNFDDVGDDFADEARKIQQGDAEERGIYGKATNEEEEDMQDEGIEFYRLPGAPRRDD